MEDWQQWQIRADQIAADLGKDVETLERETFDEGSERALRGFWPRFREMKERVRTAPAIRLEAKLDLERRLRTLGSRAYKAQEAAYARSAERKTELLSAISELRTRGEGVDSPRELRGLRRELDRLRDEFDAGVALVPADRQAVWDAWSEANQATWSRLIDLWGRNEAALREVLGSARDQLQRGNADGARRSVRQFFEALKTREAKQEAVTGMKAEADQLRRQADDVEEREAARALATSSQSAPAAATWRADVDRNRELMERLQVEVADLERQFEASESILEGAMIRGTLVDKRRKLVELERSTKDLERRIEQSEETPLISVSQ